MQIILVVFDKKSFRLSGQLVGEIASNYIKQKRNSEYSGRAYRYSEEVNEFIKDVYSFEEQYPEYGLNNYISIHLINDIKWDEVEMSKAKVDELSGQAVVALIIGVIRAERFCNGALEVFLANGCILKWLHRFEEL